VKKPGAVFIFIALLVLFLILLAPRIAQVQKLSERSNNLEIELKKLQDQNKKLEDELRMLREDPVYIEKVAREKFRKAKQGEIVYKVVKEGESAETKI
jgi:cell division protein FtsB